MIESFPEVSNLLDDWLNESSRWIIESIDSFCLNVSKYNPLSASSYILLSAKLLGKKLINIQNKDEKCFLWCHVRMLNLKNTNPQRICKLDKQIAGNLDYSDTEFPINIHDYEKIEERFHMCINVFGYENEIYPLYISKKKSHKILDVLLITNGVKSHYVFIKDFNALMNSKTKNDHKKWFCKSCLQHFTKEEVLNEHKKYA